MYKNIHNMIKSKKKENAKINIYMCSMIPFWKYLYTKTGEKTQMLNVALYG